MENTYTQEELDFLQQSNYIEKETSQIAFDDAVKAWQYAKDNIWMLESDLACQEYIYSIHERLMKRIRPDIAGKRRKVNVMVWGNLCPNPGCLQRMMIQWTGNHKSAKTEEEIKLAHIAFESMHPFEDGNGRTGRIIYNIQRYKAGLPIHIIWEDERFDYYEWFR